MNRKERRRLEKEAQKNGARNTPSSPETGGQAQPTHVTNLLSNHAMGADSGGAAMAQMTNELSQKLDWELQQISSQLNSGLTGEALKACENLNALYPNNPDVQQLSGIAFFMNQDWVNAAKCFDAVLEQNPLNAQALNYLGDLALEKSELDKAEKYFRRANNALPDDQATLQRLAYVLQRQENMAEAADIYSVLIKKDSRSAEIRLNYGYALFKSGQTIEAVKEYQKAIKLNPNLGLAHINMGVALSELDEDDEAIEAFRHGLLSLPNHVDGLFGLARCLRAQDEYQEAADFYLKALELAPNKTEAYWELGYSLELAGDKEGGQKAYEQCLGHHPDHSVARHLLDSLMGNNPETAPQDYIQELFDDYAESFDDNLVNELEYVVPSLLNTRLKNIGLKKPIASVLDLGGGTGLVAVEIKDHIKPKAGIIHGVDLSSGMIDVANQNNRYTDTFVSDIAEFLQNHKIGLPHYELIIAGDVFVYIGNLEHILAGVCKRLNENGLFLFTIEQSQDENYKLQSTGRYAHSKSYVKELAKKFNFDILGIEKIVPRKDGNLEIQGYLVSLQKT